MGREMWVRARVKLRARRGKQIKGKVQEFDIMDQRIARGYGGHGGGATSLATEEFDIRLLQLC